VVCIPIAQYLCVDSACLDEVPVAVQQGRCPIRNMPCRQMDVHVLCCDVQDLRTLSPELRVYHPREESREPDDLDRLKLGADERLGLVFP
jgi:hypothetical protein